MHYDADGDGPDAFRAKVADLGYSVPDAEPSDPRQPTSCATSGPRLVVAVGLGIPVLLISMVPALMFSGWQWVVFALSTPVIFWAAGRSTAPRW